PVGIDKWMPLGGDDFDTFQPDTAQFVGDKVCSSLYVGFMFFQCADTGNAEKILQFTEKSLLVVAGEFNGGRSHGIHPFSGRASKLDIRNTGGNATVYREESGRAVSPIRSALVEA